jgi:hypothetical protein
MKKKENYTEESLLNPEFILSIINLMLVVGVALWFLFTN